MITIRVRFENGYFVPLDPVTGLEDGEVITVTISPVDEDSSFYTMLASEAVLRRLWDTPEEDEAWKHL